MLPTCVKIIPYNAPFSSRNNYCHFVWGVASLRNKEKLMIVQEQEIRTIANLPWHSHTMTTLENSAC